MNTYPDVYVPTYQYGGETFLLPDMDEPYLTPELALAAGELVSRATSFTLGEILTLEVDESAQIHWPKFFCTKIGPVHAHILEGSPSYEIWIQTHEDNKRAQERAREEKKLDDVWGPMIDDLDLDGLGA